MRFNIFEGARRMSLLVAGIAVVGTLIVLATYEPYISVQYSIASPNAVFVRIEDSCPSDAGRHFFSAKTSKGESISVDLCLLAMSFGKDNTSLIPYKIDEQGMVWGAASYSSEVSNYERKLEGRFKLSANEEKLLKKEISRRYWGNWLSGLGYLVVGLAIFALVVWSVGWIMRGFLGIPRGMDKRPE